MVDAALTQRAEALVDVAEVDASAVVGEALALADHEGADAWVRSVALRAVAIAFRSMDRFDDAAAYFDAAILAAGEGGASDAEAEALISRSALHAITGGLDDALADLDRADRLVDGFATAHVAVQRANVVHQAGRLDWADELYATALDLCRLHGLPLERARLYCNRSLIAIERGRYVEARRSLERARRLLTMSGRSEEHLPLHHNLGYLALREGDVIGAVTHLETHRRLALGSGASPFTASSDLAESLLRAGLAADAERESLAAAHHFTDRGAPDAAAHGFGAAARAALTGGRAADAVRHVRRALDAAPDERSVWYAVHETTLVEAMVAAGDPGGDELGATLAHAIATLAEAGLRRHEYRARLIEVKLAIAHGRTDEAMVALEALPVPSELEHRDDYWQLIGRSEAIRGRHDRSERALWRAMVAVMAMADSVGWAETATSSGPQQVATATAGLQAALANGAAPNRLLRWMEACHRSSPDLRRADVDRVLADRVLAEVRQATNDVTELIEAGGHAREVAAAASRQARAEDEAGRVLRSRAHRGRARPVTGPALARATRRLRDCQLLELAEVDGRLHAVTVHQGRVRHHELGSAHAVRTCSAAVRATIRSAFGRSGGSDPLVDPMLRDLDALVLPADVGAMDAPLVVVPSAGLSSVPFGALPSLRRRSFWCAPSLLANTDPTLRSTRRDAVGGALLVAGPGLQFADREVEAIATLHRDARVLAGGRANGRDVVDGLDVEVLHVACHGVVRHEAPLFSALRLADGPLAVHTLASVARLPRLVVLSACDVGQPIRSGGRALVLPAALNGLGVATVIASSLVVPDESVVWPMVELHRLLLAGQPPADALRTLRTTGDRRSQLVASTFLCHGRGIDPVVSSPSPSS
ncbi:MAG: CHAT domain-containing tetratricopeptide repeat protein [Actinomycetota bacterium]